VIVVKRSTAWELLLSCAALLLGCGDDGGTGTGIETDSDGCVVGDYTIGDAAEMEAFEPYACITGNLVVSSPELPAIVLPNLERVEGVLRIANNDALGRVEARSLAEVGALSIRENAGLVELDLPSLAEVVWYLVVRSNGALADLDGLGPIGPLKSELVIADNDALTNLDALSHLTHAGYNGVQFGLVIVDNEVLNDLGGLSNVTTVTKGLLISNNPGLTDLDGLSGLTSAGSIWIDGNEMLENIDGLSGVTSLGSSIRIWDNDTLADLHGLSGIASLDEPGFISILDNDSLVDLAGLDGIAWLEGDLVVSDNASLTSLGGLESLTTVEKQLWVVGDESLTSLGALAGLTTVGELLVYDNADLPDCEVCHVLAGLTGEPDPLEIHDNLDDACTPVPESCSAADPCPDYTGDDPCCANGNPCDFELNDICDCDSTCAWDAVDCEW